MANAHEVIEGIKIIAGGDSKELLEKINVEGQHDIIYAGNFDNDRELSEEEIEKMDAYGWFMDDETDSWARFT